MTLKEGYWVINRCGPTVAGRILRLDGDYLFVTFGAPGFSIFNRQDIGPLLVCAPTREQALEQFRCVGPFQEPPPPPPRETPAQALERVVRHRRISRVGHFTRLENLGSIAADGALVPRAHLEAQKQDFIPTDETRFEGRETVNLSIEFPNYRMFYRKREEMSGDERCWVVLSFDPQILCRLPFRFTATNAAAMYRSLAHPSTLKPFEALEALYGECATRRDGTRVSRDPRLSLADPTDPQAEALTSGVVPLEYLICVSIYEEAVRKSSLIPVCLRGRTSVVPSLFGPRVDYHLWR